MTPAQSSEPLHVGTHPRHPARACSSARRPSYWTSTARRWSRLGQAAAGAEDPGRDRRPLPCQVQDGIRDADRRVLRRLARADVRLMPRARVLIRPKAGILDPQGQTVERALPALGFEGVSHVHVGRLVELDVDDPARLPEMCERLLANPLIEDYEIQ